MSIASIFTHNLKDSLCQRESFFTKLSPQQLRPFLQKRLQAAVFVAIALNDIAGLRLFARLSHCGAEYEREHEHGQHNCRKHERALGSAALKSRSKGYASFDYELKDYEKSDLVRLDFLLNGDMCDALSTIVHKDRAYPKGRAVAEKLRDVIPRQQFEIPVQAAIGGKIIARETVKALRKDVLAKCYGGDITRKKKLLEKQKEGKKRMRQVGSVSVPSDAFMSVLRING